MLVTTHKTPIFVHRLRWLTLCSIVSHNHTLHAFTEANFVLALEVYRRCDVIFYWHLCRSLHYASYASA